VRLLIGTEDGSAMEDIVHIMSVFDGPMFFNNYETIELTKYADNVLSATVISYWNEIFLIAQLLSKMGPKVDSDWIARVVDSSGPHWRSIYRFHGKAYSGPCLPKDTEAFRNWAFKETKYLPQIANAAHEVNKYMEKRFGKNTKAYVYRT